MATYPISRAEKVALEEKAEKYDNLMSEMLDLEKRTGRIIMKLEEEKVATQLKYDKLVSALKAWVDEVDYTYTDSEHEWGRAEGIDYAKELVGDMLRSAEKHG
jgi:hypothetical protein